MMMMMMIMSVRGDERDWLLFAREKLNRADIRSKAIGKRVYASGNVRFIEKIIYWKEIKTGVKHAFYGIVLKYFMNEKMLPP